MKTKEQIWEKVVRDQVMNLSELAVASGYDRNALGAMSLPLIGGKISLSDFKRVVRQRQDQLGNLVGCIAAKSDRRRQSSPDTALLNGSLIHRGERPTAADLFFGRKKNPKN